MLNILLVTQFYPPLAGGGRSYRVAKLAKYWTNEGHRVAVLCADNRIDPDPSLLEGVDESRLTVLRCQDEHSGFMRCFERLFRHVLIADGKYLLAYRLMNVLMNTPIGWIPDLVFTSSAPYEVHLVGWYLKKHFGFKWIADFRDPYTLNYHYRKIVPLSRMLDRCFERRIYDLADGVVFNTSWNRRESIAAFDLQDEDKKYFVCQNGFDPDDIPAVQRITEPGPLFIVSYIGGVRGDASEKRFVQLLTRNAHALAQTGSRFRFIGNGAEAFQEVTSGTEGVLETIGFCTQKALAQYWSESHALLLLLPASAKYLGWVPQKLYSYLATGLPILALVPDGEAKDYLQAAGGHVIRDPYDEDIVGMVHALRNVYQNGNGRGRDYAERFSHLMLYRKLTEWMSSLAAR